MANKAPAMFLEILKNKRKGNYLVIQIDPNYYPKELETKEVFQHTLRCGANRIILIHNHPSGEVTPSIQDSEVTNNLFNIGKIMMIPVVDHIIIGNNKYYSFLYPSLYKPQQGRIMHSLPLFGYSI